MTKEYRTKKVLTSFIKIRPNVENFVALCHDFNYHRQEGPCLYNKIVLRGNVQKKPSIFVDIVQIEVDLPPSYLIFDKFIFDILLVMLTSIPPLEFLTKIIRF